MAEKSSPGTRQIDAEKLTWFREIKENYSNFKCLPLLTVLPLNYFMVPPYEEEARHAISEYTVFKDVA
jgi:hypothetical protein